jgi:hypothetical protein
MDAYNDELAALLSGEPQVNIRGWSQGELREDSNTKDRREGDRPTPVGCEQRGPQC